MSLGVSRRLRCKDYKSTEMLTPKVTEIRRPLEATTPDPFVLTAPPQPLGGSVAANAVPRFTH
jgi:hypothetical protein